MRHYLLLTVTALLQLNIHIWWARHS